jgi:hypothetical protein
MLPVTGDANSSRSGCAVTIRAAHADIELQEKRTMFRDELSSLVHLFAAAILLAVPVTGSAAEYSAESRIIDQAGLPGGSPAVIADSQGNAAALWEQSATLGDARSVWSNYYDAKTDTWGKARTPLAPDHRVYTTYRLAMDPAGTVFAMAMDDDGTDVYRFNVATSSWDKPWNIDAGKTSRYDAALAFGPGGDALAVWTRQDVSPEAHVKLWASRFAAASKAWSPPELVSAPAEWASNHSVAFDGEGVAFVTWSERNTKQIGGEEKTAGAIRIRRFVNGGWEAVIPSFAEYVQSDPGPLTPHLAVARKGSAFLMWNLHNRISVTSYLHGKAGGGSWSVPIEVDGDAVAKKFGPTMATDDQGNVMVVWIQQNPGERAVIFANRLVSAAKAGGWGKAPTLVAEISGDAAAPPSFVIDAAGNPLIAWTEGGPDYCRRLFVTHLTPAGWGTPTAIVASTTASASDARLAAGQNGIVMLVWQETTWKSEATRRDDFRYIKARRLR